MLANNVQCSLVGKAVLFSVLDHAHAVLSDVIYYLENVDRFFKTHG